MNMQDRIKDADHRSETASSRKTSLVVFLILIISVMALATRMVLPYLLAVTMGGILALLSQPAFQWLRSRHFKARTASTLVTLGVLFLVIVPISFFLTKVVQQGIAIGNDLAEGGFSFQSLIDRISRWPPVSAFMGSPESLVAQIRGWIQSAGGGITAAVLGVAAHVPNLILQLALTSLACFFFLVDGNRFVHWTGDKIPMDPDVRIQVLESFKNTAISVIWATLAAATAQSAVILVSFLILGVPAAFLAAGATFIFAWIPLVGSTPVWVAAVLYLFFEGMTWKAILMVVFGLITGLVDNFVRPMVLKGRSNMHPLVSLVAIFGGIGMFGIMGVFVGPILAAVLISLLQIWPEVGDRFGLLPPSPTRAEKYEDEVPAGKPRWFPG
jgi:predicted PurR-regulated permease PerM